MKILNVILSFVQKLFKSALQEQLKILIPIAEKVVKLIAEDPSVVSNSVKRDAAVTLILQELVQKQLNYPMRLINLAIEIAVVEMNGVD